MKIINTFLSMLGATVGALILSALVFSFYIKSLAISFFIFFGGFLFYGISGSFFWVLSFCFLNFLTEFKNSKIFLSAILGSLFSGLFYELVIDANGLHLGSGIFSKQLVVMPMAILSALIYVFLSSKNE
jgi:hypothetical protein